MKSRGRKPMFTPAQVKRMRDGIAEGSSAKDLAEAYNVSVGTINYYLSGKRGQKAGTEIHEGGVK